MGNEKKEAAEGFTKRDFLKTALIGAAGVAAGGSLGPAILRAQAKPIRLGLLGVASGPIGMSGEAAFRGVQLWVDEINNKGGLLGRRVEAFQRDTFGKPEEAVRYAREFAAGADVDLIFAHGSSAEAFAIAAISKDLRKVVSQLTRPRPLRQIQGSEAGTASDRLATPCSTTLSGAGMRQTNQKNSVLPGGIRSRPTTPSAGSRSKLSSTPEKVSSQGRDYRAGPGRSSGRRISPRTLRQS